MRREQQLDADVMETVDTAGLLLQLDDFRSTPDAQDVDVWLDLPVGLHAPGAARRFVAERCASLSDAENFDVALLLSELVTNAVTHGGPAVTLHLVRSAMLVRVDVFDHGRAVSAVVPHRTSDTRAGGRGLRIVDTVATRWGTTPPSATGAKSVWFELAVIGRQSA